MLPACEKVRVKLQALEERLPLPPVSSQPLAQRNEPPSATTL
jgi:hypothetical protein